jgi:hypothetical protein
VESGRRGIEIQLGEVVDDVDEHVADTQDLGLADGGRPAAPVVIPAHGGERGDRGEVFQDGRVADVPRVDEDVAAAQERGGLGAEEPVGIGDDTYPRQGDYFFPTSFA